MNDSWYKIDYEHRRAEILSRIDARQKVLNYSLVVVGGIGAFLGAVENRWGGWLSPFLFFLAFFFAVLVLIYLQHDMMIAYCAKYLEKRVRLQDTSIPRGCLTWERFLLTRRSPSKKGWTLQTGLAFARFSPILLISVVFFSGGFWAWTNTDINGLFQALSALCTLLCLVAYFSIVKTIATLFRVNNDIASLAKLDAKNDAVQAE